MDYRISDEYDGNTRKLFRCICEQCYEEYWRPAKELKTTKCCSRKCYALFRQKTGKRVQVNCTQCNKSFKRWQHHLAKVTSRQYFCSRACQGLFFRKNNRNCFE